MRGRRAQNEVMTTETKHTCCCQGSHSCAHESAPRLRSDAYVAMVEAHDALDEAFAAHQDALVEGRVLEAKERFFAFRDGLLDHMRIEDDQLLPVYALMPDPPVGGGADLFRAEHERIRKLLDEFSRLFERLTARLTSRDLVAVIERQRLLKHVLEHHNLREQTHLYPTLDQFDDKGMLLRPQAPSCLETGRTVHAV